MQSRMGPARSADVRWNPERRPQRAAFLYVRNHHISLNRQRINFGTSLDARAWFSIQQAEKRMTKLRLLGAAALALSSALASPVMATWFKGEDGRRYICQ